MAGGPLAVLAPVNFLNSKSFGQRGEVWMEKS